jgi:hypothetical protein
MSQWRTYEEVAQQILDEQREFFGLSRVEGKQNLPAANGTTYEIDIVGYQQGSNRLVIFECRDYKNRLTQEAVGGFAYRIQVTGAGGGYLVTPIGLQSGAQLVADYEKIGVITIPRGATTEKYVLRFMHDILVKVTDHIDFQDAAMFELVKAADRSVE